MADHSATVNPGGGAEYTSLEAAIHAHEDNWTAAGQNGILTITCAGSTADTAQCTINGSTTDATHYIRIVGDCHSGLWDTDHYRLECTLAASQKCIAIQDDFVRIERLQIFANCNADASSCRGIYCDSQASSNQIRIGYCLIKGSLPAGGGGNYAAGVYVEESGARYTQCYVYNCVIWDFYNPAFLSTRSFCGLWCYYGDIFSFNNTIRRCATGAKGQGASDPVTTYNTVCDCDDSVASSDFIDFDGTLAGDYNASHDATAPGVNSQASKTFTWDDPSGGTSADYNTADTDLIAKGDNDFAGLSTIGYTDDIRQGADAITRPATWSIGAWDAAAGGASASVSETLNFAEALD